MKKGVYLKYINVIKNMYEGKVTSIKTMGKDTKEFPITVDLHQRLTLSLHLFTLVVDELISYIQDDVI